MPITITGRGKHVFFKLLYNFQHYSSFIIYGALILTFYRTITNVAKKKSCDASNSEGVDDVGSKRLNTRSKLAVLTKLTEEIAKPLEVPPITLPPIQLPPLPQMPQRPQNPEFIEGFLMTAGHYLKSFPSDVAEDLIEQMLDILNKKRREFRRNTQ